MAAINSKVSYYDMLKYVLHNQLIQSFSTVHYLTKPFMGMVLHYQHKDKNKQTNKKRKTTVGNLHVWKSVISNEFKTYRIKIHFAEAETVLE